MKPASTMRSGALASIADASAASERIARGEVSGARRPGSRCRARTRWQARPHRRGSRSPSPRHHATAGVHCRQQRGRFEPRPEMRTVMRGEPSVSVDRRAVMQIRTLDVVPRRRGPVSLLESRWAPAARAPSRDDGIMKLVELGVDAHEEERSAIGLHDDGRRFACRLRDDLADAPGVFAGAVGSERRSACSAATTTAMPMPQLNTRCISSSATLPCRCSQSKIVRRSHVERDRRACIPGGSMRGTFSRRPPPVMCAIPFTGTTCISASTGLT